MSPRPVFFCKQYKMTFRQLRNGRFLSTLAMTRKSRLERRFWTKIYEKFPFRGHLPPQPQTWRWSNRYLTQSRLQVKGCTAARHCLFHVVDKGPASFQYFGQLFLYDVRLRSYGMSKLPNFRILAYFSHTKLLKCTFR